MLVINLNCQLQIASHLIILLDGYIVGIYFEFYIHTAVDFAIYGGND